MTEDKIWYLKQIDLFEGISDQEIMSIADKMVEKKCHKKEILYTPFEIINSISILKKGEVTLYNSHHGKKLIIDVLKPGSIFGNITFDDKPNTHFAEVTENSYLCTFPISDFMKIIQAKPQIMLKLLKFMSDRLSDYEKKIKTGLYDAKEKIIHHLESRGRKKSNNILSKITGNQRRITHENISQHTGLSRETVTRAIIALKKEGRVINGPDGNIMIRPNFSN